MTPYRPLYWIRDFDENDNTVFEADSIVVDDESRSKFRVTSRYAGDRIIWSTEKSDLEVIQEFHQDFATFSLAQAFCETQNQKCHKAFEIRN